MAQVNIISSQSTNPGSVVQTVATALLANVNRNGFQIQNLQVATLAVLLGTGATSTVYHEILSACTALGDGKGGIFSMLSGVCYQGIVSVNGSGATYVVLEL